MMCFRLTYVAESQHGCPEISHCHLMVAKTILLGIASQLLRLPLESGACNLNQISCITSRAAAMVLSMSSSECAMLVKPASKEDGAK